MNTLPPQPPQESATHPDGATAVYKDQEADMMPDDSTASLVEEQSAVGDLDTTRLEREIATLREQLAAMQKRAESAETKLAKAESHIYELEVAVMEAEVAMEAERAGMREELTQAKAELERTIKQLLFSEAEADELRTANETDALTGVANRKALDEALPRAEADPEQEIISFDANGFGKVNKIQEYGPTEGDIQIRRVANAIRIAARGFGISPRQVFRRGGDEFVVIVPRGEVEYTTRDAEGRPIHTEPVSVADAVIRRAAELYRHRRYSGTYGDTDEPLETIISLTGASGPTFTEADGKLQAAKLQRKAELAQQYQ